MLRWASEPIRPRWTPEKTRAPTIKVGAIIPLEQDGFSGDAPSPAGLDFTFSLLRFVGNAPQSCALDNTNVLGECPAHRLIRRHAPSLAPRPELFGG